MRLGILETGEPPASLASFGRYPAMFERLLGRPGWEFVFFDVREQVYPNAPDDCEAYLVTGSAADAYADAAWIVRLKDFLNEVKSKVPLVGICFGHQVLAEAFGGKVAKAPVGWGIGRHQYEVMAPQPWTGDATTIALPASHQDQIVALPPGAEVVAGNDFCPYGVLAYRDHPAISMQLHPEFSTAYATALAVSRQDAIAGDVIDAALVSLAEPADQLIAAQWIVDFLNQARWAKLHPA